MIITKANKLPETQYLEMLNVAKHLRKKYCKSSSFRPWRVYTEARTGGLRSKMEIKQSKKGLNKIRKIAGKKYPHLNITIEMHNPKSSWSSEGICIFVKVK